MHNHHLYHVSALAGSFWPTINRLESWSAVSWCAAGREPCPTRTAAAFGYEVPGPAPEPIPSDAAIAPAPRRFVRSNRECAASEGKVVVFPSYVFNKSTPFYGRTRDHGRHNAGSSDLPASSGGAEHDPACRLFCCEYATARDSWFPGGRKPCISAVLGCDGGLATTREVLNAPPSPEGEHPGRGFRQGNAGAPEVVSINPIIKRKSTKAKSRRLGQQAVALRAGDGGGRAGGLRASRPGSAGPGRKRRSNRWSFTDRDCRRRTSKSIRRSLRSRKQHQVDGSDAASEDVLNNLPMGWTGPELGTVSTVPDARPRGSTARLRSAAHVGFLRQCRRHLGRGGVGDGSIIQTSTRSRLPDRAGDILTAALAGTARTPWRAWGTSS